MRRQNLVEKVKPWVKKRSQPDAVLVTFSNCFELTAPKRRGAIHDEHLCLPVVWIFRFSSQAQLLLYVSVMRDADLVFLIIFYPSAGRIREPEYRASTQTKR